VPLRLQRPIGRSLHEKLVRAYAQEAVRLRELAAGATTARVRLRLLDEAENQERLAQAAKRGIVQPQPMRV
jgi:histone H3/H4